MLFRIITEVPYCSVYVGEGLLNKGTMLTNTPFDYLRVTTFDTINKLTQYGLFLGFLITFFVDFVEFVITATYSILKIFLKDNILLNLLFGFCLGESIGSFREL